MQPSTFSPALGTSQRAAAPVMPAVAITPAMFAAPASSHLALGIAILVAELFTLQTRLFEFILAGFHIPMVISIMLGVALLFYMSPQSWNLSRKTTALMVMGFVWLSMATVFSTWRSNSVTELSGYTFLAMVGVAIIVLIDTPARFSWILSIIGFFYGVTALMAFFLAQPDAPRLALWRGMYSDPNLYGLTVVTGVPIMWWLMRSSNAVVRLMAFTLSVAMYWVVLKTGSRGAFIALGFICLLALIYASPMRKVIIVAAMAMSIMGASLFLSTYAKNRLFTIFSSNVSEEQLLEMNGVERDSLGGDVGSSESRWQLLVDSLEITVKHPLLGVGPGNFGDARWAMHLARIGKNIAAQTTHNTYTQLSSEAGLFGLVIFIAQIIDAFRNLKMVRKWNSYDGYMPSVALLSAAHYLRFVLVGMCIGMFFLSLAYNSPFYIMAGLSLALRNTVEKEWHRYVAAKGAMVPSTAPPDLRHPVLRMA